MRLHQTISPAAATFALDDLIVGQRAQFDAVITGDDVDAFAALSGDASPLHVDSTFAHERGFADRVVHGAHLVALASRLVGMYLPGRNALLLAGVVVLMPGIGFILSAGVTWMLAGRLGLMPPAAGREGESHAISIDLR